MDIYTFDAQYIYSMCQCVGYCCTALQRSQRLAVRDRGVGGGGGGGAELLH
eukprot:COSAG01_NODE_7695_length_3095_cov_6.943258_1_plen_50_part_10